MDISSNKFLEIRDRIFEAISESRMSQKEFAQKIQVSPQTVTDWKKGKSSSFAGMIGKIAIVLSVAPVWLMLGEGEKHLSQEQCEALLFDETSYILDSLNVITKRLERFTKVDVNSNTIFIDPTSLQIAKAYYKADPGTQAAVRKLLDVKSSPQESGHTKETI